MTYESVARVEDFGVKIDATDFELFQIPAQFAQDCAVLDARWKALHTRVHPDRFATQGAAAQRVAMQWAVRVNEAHWRLKSPLTRAAYLCELNGQPIGAEPTRPCRCGFSCSKWRGAKPWKPEAFVCRCGAFIGASA